jgi:plasmid stabilization system protein ParE
MGSKPFRFHPEALQDFRHSIEWYRSQSPRASVDFRITVSEAIRGIAQAPHLWPRYIHESRRLVLRRFPFSIIYLDDVDIVNIVAVAHSKRKPGYWEHRL